MSHISKIELEILDLETLIKACSRLGLQFLMGRRAFRYYGGNQTCDHAIHVPSASYEIGVVQSGGKYELRWDDWSAGGLQKELGPGAGRLKQAYAIERVRKQAKASGYKITETKKENAIRITLSL